ncbi:MAG: DUF3836 domain-containing protein [Bacteroidales bacterium]|nr:DUF3836 domain-containing protein [Bacteroidales bacterium]
MKLSTIITALLMCFTLNANASNDIDLKHCYEHDVFGRITSQTAYAWNGEEWIPALRWNYTYSFTGYTVELSRWNARQHNFDSALQRTVYAFTPDHTSAYVTTYSRSDANSPFQLIDTMLATFPAISSPQKNSNPHP